MQTELADFHSLWPVAGSLLSEHLRKSTVVCKTHFLFTGHIRIRAKSQGMALSLGDKINTTQKNRPKKQLQAAPAAEEEAAAEE